MADQIFSSPNAPLPLFYRSPTLLRFADHARFGLRPNGGFRFAAAATAIPLVGAEFAAAGRHFPIVFASDESAMPLAVTGVAADRNLFVTPDGQWMVGSYVPSYVRRYPFIAVTVEGGENTMLGFDATSDLLSSDAGTGAAALFDTEGKATETSLAAMAICEAYSAEHTRTEAFAQALKVNNLLVERSAQMNYADAGHARVQGFRLIDEAAFRALPDPVVVEFHAKGWLDLIVLHLASQSSWQVLLEASAPKT